MIVGCDMGPFTSLWRIDTGSPRVNVVRHNRLGAVYTMSIGCKEGGMHVGAIHGGLQGARPIVTRPDR